jgi:hypothetical protein
MSYVIGSNSSYRGLSPIRRGFVSSFVNYKKGAQVNWNCHNSKGYGVRIMVLMPLLTLFKLYHGRRFY